MEQNQNETLAVRVSTVSIAVNLILSLLKLVTGIFGKSNAMISDAIHSASDVFSTVVVIVGVKMAQKKADEEHPYGHERMECAAAMILAMLLAVVGFGIGASGIQKILSGNSDAFVIPTLLPLIAAVVSIAVKEWMFWYTKSIGSFLGILFSRMGYPVMDAVASVIICLCIFKAAYDIFKDGLDKMVDHCCDAETVQKIRDTALSIEGVRGIDDLKTRLFGDKIYVDLEILVEKDLKLIDAHTIAEQVHAVIEHDFPKCKHCMVHVNPW